MPTASLPVLMYHYISRHEDAISVSPDVFAEHCRVLAENGWRGVGLDEAEGYFLRGETLPPKSFLITFDDGYLDNYVYAWPFLREHGHKGVIFAVADRMEDGEPRATLDDVRSGRVPRDGLPRVDQPFVRHEDGYEVRRDPFINWAEARLMEASGVVAVASHTLSHQGVFINDDWQGFFLPGRQGRTFHNPDPLVWGMPRFVMGPSLAGRAFVPDPDMVRAIRDLVPQDEGEAFRFAQEPASLDALRELVRSFAGRLGRMETDAEMTARMEREIVRSKAMLEQGLGRGVHSLCWPWGAYTAGSLQLAREAGFSVFFTTAPGPNPPCLPLAVHRFKAKARPGSWLLNRVRLYSRPWLASLYARLQLRSPKKGKRKAFVVGSVGRD